MLLCVAFVITLLAEGKQRRAACFALAKRSSIPFVASLFSFEHANRASAVVQCRERAVTRDDSNVYAMQKPCFVGASHDALARVHMMPTTM